MFGQEEKKIRSVWDSVEFEAHPGKVIQSAVGYLFFMQEIWPGDEVAYVQVISEAM